VWTSDSRIRSCCDGARPGEAAKGPGAHRRAGRRHHQGLCGHRGPAGELASRLIEKAGLRGKRVNGAEISSKHTNFIVNRGGAGAADILSLMELTRERVHAHSGITLETEIRILGE